MSTLMAKQRTAESNGWELRHNSAVGKSSLPRHMETSMIGLLENWKHYAKEHHKKNGALIADDGYCGPAWLEIGHGIRSLFSGEIGRLDGGTLDTFYCEVLEENGFNDEGEVI